MLKKTSNRIFQDGVREAVAITASVNKNWLSKEGIEKTKKYSVWKYIGTHNGVFRMFPGSPLYKSFDHTGRPWYRKAMSNRHNYILTPPYFDAGGSGVILTLAKAVFEGSGVPNSAGSADHVFAVMGLDFSVKRFKALMKKISPDCGTSAVTCLAMDNSGHLIFHDHLSLDSGIAEQIHIVDQEPDIAEHLIENNYMTKHHCVDVSINRENSFWMVEIPAQRSAITAAAGSLHYKLYPVQFTNVFFIKKYTSRSHNRCSCPKKKTSSVSYVDCGTVYSCQCPCSKSTVFDYCVNEFPRNSERAPVCRPDSPPVTDTATLGNKKATDFPHCFDYECHAQSNQRQCEDIVGCDWCKLRTKCLRHGDECIRIGPPGALSTEAIVGIILGVFVTIGVITNAICRMRRSKRKP